MNARVVSSGGVVSLARALSRERRVSRERSAAARADDRLPSSEARWLARRAVPICAIGLVALGMLGCGEDAPVPAAPIGRDVPATTSPRASGERGPSVPEASRDATTRPTRAGDADSAPRGAAIPEPVVEPQGDGGAGDVPAVPADAQPVGPLEEPVEPVESVGLDAVRDRGRADDPSTSASVREPARGPTAGPRDRGAPTAAGASNGAAPVESVGVAPDPSGPREADAVEADPYAAARARVDRVRTRIESELPSVSCDAVPLLRQALRSLDAVRKDLTPGAAAGADRADATRAAAAGDAAEAAADRAEAVLADWL